MPTSLTGVAPSTNSLSAPVGGDPRTSASVRTPMQLLLNNDFTALTLRGQVISVKEHGALGDGTTDDSTAVADAMTAADAANVGVFFPPGAYPCNNITWPADVSLYGIPGQSIIYDNHVTNPILSSASADGVGSSASLSRVVSGLEILFSPLVANTGGVLLRISNDNRTKFRDCYFGDTNSTAASTAGLIELGSAGDITHADFDNCGFNFANNSNGMIVRHLDGTTLAALRNCKIRMTSSARTATNALFRATHLRVTGNNRFDLSSATALTSMLLLQAVSSGTIECSGNHITDLAGGSLVMFGTLAGGTHISEAANRIPLDATFANNMGSASALSTFGSREGRYTSVNYSGGGSLTLEPDKYSMIHVAVLSNTPVTISANSMKLGATFDLVFHNSTGSPTSITWDSSFGGFASAGTGAAPPVVSTTGNFASCRFVRSNGVDGTAWYPVGSAIQAT